MTEQESRRLMQRMAAQVDELTEGQIERNARIRDLERELETLCKALERYQTAAQGWTPEQLADAQGANDEGS